MFLNTLLELYNYCCKRHLLQVVTSWLTGFLVNQATWCSGSRRYAHSAQCPEAWRKISRSHSISEFNKVYWRITLPILPSKVYYKMLDIKIRPIVKPWFRRNNVQGFIEVYPTSPHVLCGSVEGVWLCSSIHPVDGAPAVRSMIPYDRSRSLVCIAVSKSDLFPLHIEL